MKSHNDPFDGTASERLCGDIRRQLGIWYEMDRRDLPWRKTHDAYAVWVSEVMLQQTRVKTAIPYYQRFMALFPDVAHLAAADEQAVLKAWEGLGYYARARHMHRAAAIMVREFGARVPDRWPDLRRLPGVGDYIAAAVLSIAMGQPYAVVDGNVKRVLARLFEIEMPVNQPSAHPSYQELADRLLDPADPGRHNQAVMELGAMVCIPRRPMCGPCPIHGFCGAWQSRTIDRFPVRVRRPNIPQKRIVAGVVLKTGRLLLTQRPGQGLLAGLWEFPGGSPTEGQDGAAACAQWIRQTTGLQVEVRQRVITVEHAYTHFKLRMELYLCVWRKGRVRLNGPAAFRWVSVVQLSGYPLHKAVHKALPALIRLLSKSEIPDRISIEESS